MSGRRCSSTPWVELVALDIDRAHLLIADVDLGGVGVGVEPGADLQPGGRCVEAIRSITAWRLISGLARQLIDM